MYQLLSKSVESLARGSTRILAGLVILAASSAAPHLPFVPTAHAQCAPDATANVDVVCSSDDVDGYTLGGGGLPSFTVETGARVTVLPPTLFQPAVILVDGTVDRFANQGQILAIDPGQDAVSLGGVGPGGFLNNGIIDSDAGFAPSGIGVYVNGNIVGPFLNNGQIFGLGGVIVDGTIASFVNTGEIGADIDGVFADTIDTIINTGEIFGAGNGIVASSISSIVNHGLIDSGGDGIDVDGGSSDNDEASTIGLIINNGTIRGDDDGIDVGTLTKLVNTGTIIGGFLGADESGIAAAVITEIVNSGVIRTDGDITNAFAIEERGRPADTGPPNRPILHGGPTTLTLNAGSIIIGRIDLGGDGANTLNIGRGRSVNSTFEDPDGESVVPVLGSLAGHLFAFQDTANMGGGTDRQMVAVDLSAFQGFDDAFTALTSGYGQVVHTRQAGLRFGEANGFSAGDLDGAVTLADNHVWVEGFGAFRHDQSDRIGGDFDHLTGGLVAGVDRPLDDVTSIGAMAGFAVSTSENDINTQTNTATSFYAGLYGSTQAIGIAWDASLTVGYTDYEAERITANNLVAGGLESARADFGGWFINPQVTASREASNPLSGQTIHGFTAAQNLEQSLTLSYAGLFLDGYTETGTTNPLTLNDRSVHIASARAALALPFERTEADGALTTLRLIGGLEAHTQFGDDSVSGTLLGQAVGSTLDDNAFNAGAFLGLSGEYQTTSGLTAYADIEAMLETDLSYQISASAGLRLAF